MTDQLATTTLDVRPMAPNIGAEVFGIDLSQPLHDATVGQVRAALLRWKVIFFRDQFIGPAEQVAFGRRFGEVTPAHPILPSIEGYPEVLPLSSEAYALQDPASEVDNNWHTDVTFSLDPPMGSILRGVTVPPYGGDTLWTNLVAAYEGLSPTLRRFVDGLQAVHRNAIPSMAGVEIDSELLAQFLKAARKTVHPVVRVHPETGERALFVNPFFTDHIVGLNGNESHRLLNMLYDHMLRPDYVVRFRWAPGSIAFWDNRATAHRAPTDVHGTGFDRYMERITIAGDVPVGPDGFTSQPA